MTGIVLNPAAGHGRAGRQWPAIEVALRSAFGDLEVRATTARGDATRLARELLDRGVETIIAIGGDGTCNEVANAGTPCLGVLSVGSAGDFARTLGVPRDWRAGVEWLRRARPRAVDAARATFTSADGAPQCRRFLNMASFGLGGRAVRHAGTPYLLAVLREFWGGCPEIEIAVDDAAHRGSFLHVAVGNGRYQGAAMRVCPQAEVDDGWLDVTAVGPVTLLDLAINLPKLYSGTLLGHPKVRSWRGRFIRAVSRSPVPVELDGDPAGFLPLEIQVEPSALRVLA